MAEQSAGVSVTPHFVIDPDASPEDAEILRGLEQDIYDQPGSFLKPGEGDTETPISDDNPNPDGVGFALSREGNRIYSFDEFTEAAISKDALVRRIQHARSVNSKDKLRAERLAIRAGDLRLAIFIRRVMATQQTETGAAILPMPVLGTEQDLDNQETADQSKRNTKAS